MRCCTNRDNLRNTLIIDENIIQKISEKYLDIINKVVSKIPKIVFSPH